MFREVVQDYLKCVTFGQDGYASLIRLPAYGEANVVANPRRAFGQLIFADAGTRVENVIDRFYAGDSIGKVAQEFGVTREQVEAALRVGRLASAPELFVDRSLGRYEVPDALRAAGLTVHAMADLYGENWGQTMDGEDWLADVAGAG